MTTIVKTKFVLLMNTILKTAREKKGLKTREIAQILKIDQALISKFESGARKPTKEQVLKLASLLEIDLEKILVLWLKEKILHEIKDEKFSLEALKLVEKELLNTSLIQPKTNSNLQKIFDEIAVLQKQLTSLNPFELRRITKQIELELTFECNRINGNSLTFDETKLVINEGIIIEEKPMKEHLETINFYESVQYCKDLIQKKTRFTEKELLELNGILLRGIETKISNHYAEKETSKEIELFFKWFESSLPTIPPIILAAEAHLKIMAILPFKNYNNQIALLLMNFVLLQSGLHFAILKGDALNKEKYIATLEESLIENKTIQFVTYIAQLEKDSLNYALSL